MDILLANPRGFCAGVERAIEIVERALETYGAPVYVLHEIVHNRAVVDDLSSRGVRFVEDLAQIPPHSVAIFSAHGVADPLFERARERELHVIDATCPLVEKVHVQARRYTGEGRELILVGHEGHPEVEGTRGCVEGPVHVVATEQDVAALWVEDPSRLAYVTQTTLSVDDTRRVVEALRTRFPDITGPELRDICYATQNRQNAVKEIAPEVDVLLVVGSRNSSNSNRLRELAEQLGVTSYQIDGPHEVQPGWLAGARRVGVTSGASAPEALVQAVVQRLRALGAGRVVEVDGEAEDVTFRLPTELASA